MINSKRPLRARCILSCVVLSLVLVSCGSSALPASAKSALDECIKDLSGRQVEYEIVSAQKARGAPEDASLEEALAGREREAGVCPPGGEGEETWCVKIDRAIADEEGTSVSHFLVRRLGRTWQAEELADSEKGVYHYSGCDNW